MRGGGYSQHAMLGGWRRPYASGLYGRGVLRVPFERIQNHYLVQSPMHYLRTTTTEHNKQTKNKQQQQKKRNRNAERKHKETFLAQT